MKKEFTLTAFEDHNGVLGWGIGELDNTFEEIDACVDGRLLAHDMLEHNHKSNLTGIENELEALGAIGHVRGMHLQLDSDLLFMANSVAYRGLDVPRETPEEIEYDFECFVNSAAKDLNREVSLDELDSDERINLRDYLRHAATYMQNGFEWAQKYYQDCQPSYIFEEIQRTFCEPEWAGIQMKVNIDFNDHTVVWCEHYPEDDDYDY